jgi:hypothetical protein
MFEKHEIWRNTEEAVLRHLIFRDITTNLYYLQQADSLYANGPKEQLNSLRFSSVLPLGHFRRILPASVGDAASKR